MSDLLKKRKNLGGGRREEFRNNGEGIGENGGKTEKWEASEVHRGHSANVVFVLLIDTVQLIKIGWKI